MRSYGCCASASDSLPARKQSVGISPGHPDPHSKVVSRRETKQPFRQDRSGNLVAEALRNLRTKILNASELSMYGNEHNYVPLPDTDCR
jgi:hypothetical protein